MDKVEENRKVEFYRVLENFPQIIIRNFVMIGFILTFVKDDYDSSLYPSSKTIRIY